MRMMKALLKRYLPRSLFGRALMILVLPIVLLQLVVTGLFIQRHYAGVTEQMADAVALELNYIVETVESAPDDATARARLAELARPLNMRLELMDEAAIPSRSLRHFYDVSGDALSDTLRRRVTRPLTVDLVTDRRSADVRILTARGVLRAVIPRRRVIASNPHLLLVWMAVTASALVVVAVLFLRNQVRPIRQLAEAADSFGKGRPTPFRPAGAEEVRRAGAAFLDMRRRIERQIEQRSKMLSAVSHDLRTPLTRMKLALAMAEDSEETRELMRDVDEMERMLGELLDFASGGHGEEPEPTDPVAMAHELAADAARMGRALELRVEGAADPDAPPVMRPGAVRRAVQNLLDNAARHGERARLTLRIGPRSVEFVVEDDGPGIAPDQREAALRAFSRLDEARNQDSGGGVGLGLSIALDVARAHGGALELGDSADLGGLRATLRLPR
ncbi:two-component system, OmpR family, osmolarity sensor histidine kinase EnvZ [Oceanicella actignis]|uniref:histidine kinase n=2 Tax=Oceanicella actignis TaxID=1189325 RepID=A0A1M7T3S9_9RHOB|nr:two-component system, OmpR family, osmolarity sensor histidine kinase EnvZ [Oceanicella actignis]SHN65368.1 two-component system, OmpR family, osmolarity sensor histidine kinase EnvZ [Oceanicella actignis]